MSHAPRSMLILDRRQRKTIHFRRIKDLDFNPNLAEKATDVIVSSKFASRFEFQMCNVPTYFDAVDANYFIDEPTFHHSKSPTWRQRRLASEGSTSRSTSVLVTNYRTPSFVRTGWRWNSPPKCYHLKNFILMSKKLLMLGSKLKG